MSDRVKVRVVEFGDRQHYQLQWTDPMTGKKKTRSSGIERTGRQASRRDAERKAAELEATLQHGLLDAGKLTWQACRTRYENEVLMSLAERTASKIDTVFNAVERILNPQRLRDLNADRLSYFQSKLREQKLSDATIKGRLAHLMASLR